jgi:outer membrane protein assembly factor BamB
VIGLYDVIEWDVASGKQVARLEGFFNSGITLTYNHSGTLVASDGWEARLRLWNPRTGEQLFQTPASGVVTPRFSADDRLLVDMGEQRLRLWEVVPAREFRCLTPDSDKGSLGTCSICPMNDRLLASSTKYGIGLWDLTTGEPIEFLAIGHSHPVWFDASGAMVTDTMNTHVHRFPLVQDAGIPGPALHFGPPQPIVPLGKFGLYFACSADGSVVASGQRNGALVWHREDPEKAIQLTPHFDVRYVSVSHDGQLVATGSHGEPTAKVWDARTGRLLKSFEFAAQVPVHVHFSPDKKWLLTGGSNHRLWRVDTWEPGPELGDGECAAISPDSSYVAMETGKGAVRLVDIKSGREFARLEDPKQEHAHLLTIHPDGTKLLTTSMEYKAIHVWDLRAIRAELVKFGLDWKRPAFPPPKDSPGPATLRVTVDLGELAPKN